MSLLGSVWGGDRVGALSVGSTPSPSAVSACSLTHGGDVFHRTLPRHARSSNGRTALVGGDGSIPSASTGGDVSHRTLSRYDPLLWTHCLVWSVRTRAGYPGSNPGRVIGRRGLIGPEVANDGSTLRNGNAISSLAAREAQLDERRAWSNPERGGCGFEPHGGLFARCILRGWKTSCACVYSSRVERLGLNSVVVGSNPTGRAGWSRSRPWKTGVLQPLEGVFESECAREHLRGKKTL